jgi:glutaminase
MNYGTLLNEIYEEVKGFDLKGKVATYIPELASVDADKFGIHLLTIDGEEFSVGDSDETFSIQSISKVLSLAQTFSIIGEKLWKRVDVEPSGTPFNSIVQLEYEKGIPRNPFINAGALVIADILISNLADPEKEFLSFVQNISENQSINYNEKVAASEKENGFLNASLANMLKFFGNIENDIERILSFYFHQCSIEMSCRDLSRAFLAFASHGEEFAYGDTKLTGSQVKRTNAIMQTCGFYDEAGEFSFRVGLPGKSGVGGGIVAIYPNKYSVAVWSPRLNEKGNSVLGMKTLELLTTKTGSSIF